MASYSIKDIEKLSGIKAHTLRMWERRYNLVEPKRTNTNIRFYTDDDLRKIMNVAFLNRNGIKISSIVRLDKNEISEKVSEFSKMQSDKESQIDNLLISMIELDEKRFEKIINTSITQFGFEDTILYTIYPFFEKVGILWQTGVINPSQEHFVTNLIRQKLIVAIDGVIENEVPQPRNFVLYLPEGELHEIGLLFYYYLIKKSGHRSVYLGQTVPFKDLSSVVEIRKCDSLLTTFSSKITGIDVVKYLRALSVSFPQKTIYFSGNQNVIPERNFPSNIKRINNALHFRDILQNLRLS